MTKLRFCVLINSHHQSSVTVWGGVLYRCLTIGDVDFDHLVKVSTADFAIVKSVFLLENDKDPGENTLILLISSSKTFASSL